MRPLRKGSSCEAALVKYKHDPADEPIFRKWLDNTMNDTSFLKEWLTVLLKANESGMKTANRYTTFRDKLFSEEIFFVCDALRLAPEAKYLASDLFDRFLYEHLKDLYEFVERSSDKQKTWSTIYGRVKKQLLLRIVSCCQLASKMFSHYNVITVWHVKSYLKRLGQRYGEEAICQSEMRVLKTVKYKVPLLSPTTYLDTFLALIGLNIPQMDVKPIHKVSLDILSLVYMRWTFVYDRLHQQAIGSQLISPDDRMKFSSFERDNVLLSGALIAAASHITDPDDNELIVDQLSLITKSSPEDFIDFAAIMLEMILDPEKHQTVKTRKALV